MHAISSFTVTVVKMRELNPILYKRLNTKINIQRLFTPFLTSLSQKKKFSKFHRSR